MDWNNDGKVDFKDHSLFHSEISNGGGGGSPSGCEPGCLTWILIGLVAFQILKFFIAIFN